MDSFYVNKNAQPTGEREVHTSTCPYLPAPENRIYLGAFSTCTAAMIEAKKYYNNVDGCRYCCGSCHTR